MKNRVVQTIYCCAQSVKIHDTRTDSHFSYHKSSSRSKILKIQSCLRVPVPRSIFTTHMQFEKWKNKIQIVARSKYFGILFKKYIPVNTPEPRPFKMGTFDSNAGIGAVGSGDMSSTRNNQIWSSANSFFRNNWVWPFFACFLERWLIYGSQFFLNWPVHQNLILNLNMEQKTKHKFFMLLCKKMKNKGISKIEFWPIWPLSSAIDWVLSKYWDSIWCNVSMQGTCVFTKNPTLIVKKLIFLMK